MFIMLHVPASLSVFNKMWVASYFSSSTVDGNGFTLIDAQYVRSDNLSHRLKVMFMFSQYMRLYMYYHLLLPACTV